MNTETTHPTDRPVTWADVPQSEINRELREFHSRYPSRSTCWLVPCRYADGAATCSYCLEFPCSNIQRRQFDMAGWREV